MTELTPDVLATTLRNLHKRKQGLIESLPMLGDELRDANNREIDRINDALEYFEDVQDEQRRAVS